MLRLRSSSLSLRSSSALLAAACALSTGCMSEYELHEIQDPLNVCSVGCTIDKASYWHNPNEASQNGYSVELAAWGHAESALAVSGYTVNKERRTAFGGAPYYQRGRVYYQRAGINDGLLSSATPQVLTGPYARTAEFGYSLLAADVRSGFSKQVINGLLTPVGPKAYGEEIIVGAPGTSDNAGEIYWYYSQGAVTDPWVLGGAFVPSAVVSGDRFGSAIAMSHLLDARFPDDVVTQVPAWIAVGAPGGDDVYILGVTASSSSPFTVLQTLHGTAGTGFGASLAIADFNEDGIDDLAIGSPGQNAGGRVHVFTGKTGANPIDTTDHLDIDSTLSGADEFGFSMAAGFFRRQEIQHAALVVGDPGRDSGGTTDAGSICQYQFEGTVPMTVHWSRCDGANVNGTNYRFGHAVAVGNFFATAGTGAGTGPCGVADEIAVGSPGETEYMNGLPYMPANGAVRVLASSDNGGETGETAPEILRGSTPVQSFGKAITAEYVQRNIHQDMMIGSPARDGGRGSYALTRAEEPNGSCSMAGKWTSQDSDGNSFSVEMAWDGANLIVTMLGDATITAKNGGSVCSILGTPIDFRGAVPIDPIPWPSCGVTHTGPAVLDISSLVGFSAHVEGQITYDAGSNTFELDIDETAGILGPMNNNCHIVNNPFVFTQSGSLTCD